jgi:hypothetical protein
MVKLGKKRHLLTYLYYYIFQIQVEVTEKVKVSGATQETVAITIIRKVEKIER